MTAEDAEIMQELATSTVIAVVDKDGILLVDYTKQLMDKGFNRVDALAEAGNRIGSKFTSKKKGAKNAIRTQVARIFIRLLDRNSQS